MLISIHAPCAGGDPQLILWDCNLGYISIHAPCAGGDFDKSSFNTMLVISIHAPCAGGDVKMQVGAIPFIFQSTPPVQGATNNDPTIGYNCIHFNPRPLCRGRRSTRSCSSGCRRHFNPRPLCRGRPRPAHQRPHRSRISIHAPCAGGDAPARMARPCRTANFNPRPLCRGRPLRRRSLRCKK